MKLCDFCNETVPYPCDKKDVHECFLKLKEERDVAWKALEDVVNTFEGMNLHVNNPLYERLCIILRDKEIEK